MTGRYTEEAVAYIRAHRDEPFFLYMAHMYVHTPLHPPPEYLERSRNGPYGAEVEHLDYCTGRLLDTLVELGLEGNTLVIFTSDNGAARGSGGSNAPLRGYKASTWEGGMREPCLMWWPGRIDAGGRCSEIVTSMDFYATFAALAGGDLPGDRTIDGIDFGPLIGGDLGDRQPREALFYYRANTLNAVRSGKWKLHVDQDLLFDLEQDVGETRNVFDSHPAVVSGLRELAARCREDLGDERTGVQGRDTRPAGKVDNPRTLTTLDPDDPLVDAAYD